MRESTSAGAATYQRFAGVCDLKLTILETGHERVGLALALLPCLLDSVKHLLGLSFDFLQAVLSNALSLVDILIKVLLGGDHADKVLPSAHFYGSSHALAGDKQLTSTSFC